MKRISSYVLFCLLALKTEGAFAQLVIDLSTGISTVTGQPNTPTAVDDRWKVAYAPSPCNQQPPTPTSFVSAFVTNGSATEHFCTNSAPITNSLPFNANSRWISPLINGSGIAQPTLYSGYYFYSMTFNYGCSNVSCTGAPPIVKSAMLNVNFLHSYYIDGYQTPMAIIVNGNQFPLVQAWHSSPMPWSGQVSLGTGLITPGLNTITFVYNNCPGSIIGCAGSPGTFTAISNPFPVVFNVDANITIEITNQIKDQNGTIKTSFCMEEDIFMDGGNNGSMNYKIELYANGGINLLASTPIQSGSPNSVNVTKLFKNQNYIIGPGSYTLKFLISDDCGWSSVSRNFSYECCNNPDASFSLMTTTDSKVVASSNVNGTHTWNLYSSSSVHSGQYTSIQTFNGPDFSWTGTEVGKCYYVTHTLVSDCGTTCASQAACNVSCPAAACIISAPVNVQYNPGSKTLTWAAVTNASSYLLEVVFCDPRCCINGANTPNGVNCSSNDGGTHGGGGGGGGGPTIGDTYTKMIPVNGLSYQLTSPDFVGTNFSGPPCFSIRVYAICENGMKSVPSNAFCSSNGGVASRTAYTADEISEVNSEMDVSLIPNPAMDNVSIDILAVDDIEYSISVYNTTGTKVKTFETSKTNEKKASVKWNIEGLAKGIYLVKISTANGKIFNKKLIVN